MEQFLCFTLRQDVPDFNNIMKVKEGCPRNQFICESEDSQYLYLCNSQQTCSYSN